jgi:hypothetical protein
MSFSRMGVVGEVCVAVVTIKLGHVALQTIPLRSASFFFTRKSFGSVTAPSLTMTQDYECILLFTRNS